jgi:hypothetical protein
MNANFGLIHELQLPKKIKNQAYFDRSMQVIQDAA